MLIDGEYVITPAEARQARGLAFVDHEEAVAQMKQVLAKMTALAEQLTELGRNYTSVSTSLSKPYTDQLFLDRLAECSECLNPEVLKGLLAAKHSAVRRVESTRRTLNPE